MNQRTPARLAERPHPAHEAGAEIDVVDGADPREILVGLHQRVVRLDHLGLGGLRPGEDPPHGSRRPAGEEDHSAHVSSTSSW